MHIVGPPGRFALAAGRSYATVEAGVDDYRQVMMATGIERAVVVQPSFYGTDNSCTLEALAAFGDAARGVAVIDPELAADQLKALHDAGCRGARINLATTEEGDGETIERAVGRIDARVRDLGWHLQIFAPPDRLPRLADHQHRFKCPLVVDHFGLLRPEFVEIEPARSQLQALETILDNGGWVKLSGLYRIADDFLAPSLTRLAQWLHARAPDRVVWASDWPHTPPHGRAATNEPTLLPYRDIDTGTLLTPLAVWFPDEQVRRQVLVDNPARLYGFAQ